MTYSLSLVVWLLFGFLGTLYLYHLGIKREWQEARFKKGLDKHSAKNPPGYEQKCVFGTAIYKKPCSIFLLLSGAISTCIVGIFYIADPVKSFPTIQSAVTAFLGLWFIFSIFIGSPISSSDISEEQRNKFYIKVLNLTSILKGFLIDKYINYEYEYIMSTIKRKIAGWYEKRHENNNLGALIIRIHSGFFNKMLPESCDEGIRELLSQTSLNMLNLYSRDDTTLYDELMRLFESDMMKYGASIIELAEFINNEEVLGISVTSSQIEQYLKDNLTKTASRGVKKKTSSEVMDILIKTLAQGKQGDSNKIIGA
jgi:hypothetical protein